MSGLLRFGSSPYYYCSVVVGSVEFASDFIHWGASDTSTPLRRSNDYFHTVLSFLASGNSASCRKSSTKVDLIQVP